MAINIPRELQGVVLARRIVYNILQSVHLPWHLRFQQNFATLQLYKVVEQEHPLYALWRHVWLSSSAPNQKLNSKAVKLPFPCFRYV